VLWTVPQLGIGHAKMRLHLSQCGWLSGRQVETGGCFAQIALENRRFDIVIALNSGLRASLFELLRLNGSEIITINNSNNRTN